MKSRIFLASCVLGTVLLASGCKPDYPKCETTEDCNRDGNKGVCVDITDGVGTCAECGTTADCASGFKCEGNRCVPDAECKGNFDCTGGEVCKDGKCTSCDGDKDCGAGSLCENGRCKAAPECTRDDECGGDRTCVDGKCSTPAAKPECNQGPVRFGFNEASLSDAARSSLDTLAGCLKKNQPQANVTIEGHADERGTEEYNQALGEKRANAVKRYLQNLGIPASRLRTVSYGEERPAERGSDEGAWAANRRAEFSVTSK